MNRQDVAPYVEKLVELTENKEDQESETIIGLAMIVIEEWDEHASEETAESIMHGLWSATGLVDLVVAGQLERTPPEEWGSWEELSRLAVALIGWIKQDYIFDLQTVRARNNTVNA